MAERAPLLARIVRGGSLDWDAMTPERLERIREKTERLMRSPVLKVVTGRRDRGALVEERALDLPGRRIRLRVHRPRRGGGRLPLVLVFHGGGFVLGSPVQNDWIASRLAARLPAVAVAVDFRLAPRDPLPAAVDDGYDVMARLAEDPFGWGLDPGAIAVVGESAGGTIAALLALGWREGGPRVRAQALAYPATDWSAGLADYPSMAEHGHEPGFSVEELRKAAEFAVPPGEGARYSPVLAADLAGAPPALVVCGTVDGLLDHGRRYVERLAGAGVEARIAVYPRTIHAFLSTPGIVRAARPASLEMIAFLRRHLAAPSGEGAAEGR